MTFSLMDAQRTVSRIATNLAYNWPGIAKDDIAQEINLYLVENWEHIARQTALDEERSRLVRKLAERQGASYCARERYAYQHNTAEWIYTPRELRSVLPDYFAGAMTYEPVKRPEDANQTLTGDGLSIVAMDISAGFEQLAEQDQSIMIRAYRNNEHLFTTDEKRLQRAVDRLVNILNRGIIDRFNHAEHEGPGSREVLTNAHARALNADN